MMEPIYITLTFFEAVATKVMISFKQQTIYKLILRDKDWSARDGGFTAENLGG